MGFSRLRTMRLADSEPPAHQPPLADAASLSERECEVLELMAEGLSNPEIAQRLFISTNTAVSHTRHVIAKLGASCRAEAVAVGFRLGLIT